MTVLRQLDVERAQQAHARRVKIITAWLKGSTFDAIGETEGIVKQRVHYIVCEILRRSGHSSARRGQAQLIPAIVARMEQRLLDLAQRVEEGEAA